MLSWFVLNFILIIYSNVSQLTYSYIWIKSVHPSVRKFSWNWLVSFTWNSTCCYVVMGMTKHDFLKIIFCPQNGENKPSLEFFERVGKFSFFSQFFNFFSIWSIMKVYITVIAVCLNKFHIWKSSSSWDTAQNTVCQSDCRIFQSIAEL